MFDERVCGTCQHHKRLDMEFYDRHGTEYLYSETRWTCANYASENDGYETEYGDTCDEWEERE